MLVSAGVSIGAVSQEPANTCPSWGAPIHVHVHGIRNAHGTVKASLYGPDPNTFLVKGKKADKCGIGLIDWKEKTPREANSQGVWIKSSDRNSVTLSYNAKVKAADAWKLPSTNPLKL